METRGRAATFGGTTPLGSNIIPRTAGRCCKKREPRRVRWTHDTIPRAPGQTPDEANDTCGKPAGPRHVVDPARRTKHLPNHPGIAYSFGRRAAASWERVNASQPFLYPKDFSIDPRESRRILIGACDVAWGDKAGGLYLTEDGGKSWNRIGREGPQTFGGYFHPEKEGWIYMTLTESAPGAGLWLSKDHGRSWRAFAGLPFANIQRVEFHPQEETRIYVTTFGASVWRGPIEPTE